MAVNNSIKVGPLVFFFFVLNVRNHENIMKRPVYIFNGMCAFSWYMKHIIATETQCVGMWHQTFWRHFLPPSFTLRTWNSESTRIYGVTSQRSIIIISPNTYMYMDYIIACTCLQKHTVQITSLTIILHQLGYRILVHATLLSTAQLMFYEPPALALKHSIFPTNCICGFYMILKINSNN